MPKRPTTAEVTAGLRSPIGAAFYPELGDSHLAEPCVQRTLIGPVVTDRIAESVDTGRTELKAVEACDGSISFRREPVREQFDNLTTAHTRADMAEEVLLPSTCDEDVVRSAVATHGEDAIGQPAGVHRRLRQWSETNPIMVADQFAGDQDAKTIAASRVTRLRLSSLMGLLDAVVMLVAMFPREQLLVFCVDGLQRTDLITQLNAGGVTATDKHDLEAKVLVLRSTNELANPILVQHRRIVVISDEANLTTPLMRELSRLPSTSRLVALSSSRTVNTNDDRQRIEAWLGKGVRVRHTPVGQSREVQGTFATLRQGKRSHSNDKNLTAAVALRYYVFENCRWNQAVGRLINQETADWTKRLERCDRAIIREMTAPVVIVCGTLVHAVNLLRESKRSVLATSSVGIVRKRLPDLRDRIRSVRGDLSDFDRIIVSIGDVRHLKFAGSVLRVDSLPGPLPLTEQQFANWSVSGITAPLNVVDLRRVDFRVGRANASSRAACYDADGTPMSHAPKFQPHRFPPVRYVIGCGYGTQHVVYHRRPRAERGLF